MAGPTRLRSVRDENPAESRVSAGLPPATGQPAAQSEPGHDAGVEGLRSPVPGGTGRRDKRGRRIGYNWWREYVWEQWYAADALWREQRDAECIGYPAEQATYGAYGESHSTPPRPTFKALLIQNAGLRDNLGLVA